MKTLKFFLGVVCASLLLLTSCVKEASVGSIQGIVTNASNSEPIRGVNISLSPTGLSTVTGSDGRYEFTNLQPGNYTVQGVKTGYESNTKNITIVAGNVSSGDMVLTPEVADYKLNVEYLDFGSAFSQLNFKIINTSTSMAISWNVTESLNWLSVSPSSGNLQAGQEVSVVVDIDRNKIEQSISANIQVEAVDKVIVLPVNVTVSGSDGPNLQLSETAIDFGSSATSLAFYVMNTGPEGTSLNWTCSNVNVDWLTISPTSGNTAGGASTAVMATIDRSKFTGFVSTSVTISGAGSTSTITISASTSGTGSPILQLSEGSLGFGESQNSLTFLVKNVGTAGTVLDWSIATPTVDWLTLTPMTGNTNAGSGTLVTAVVDRSKFHGSVTTTVTVNSSNNNATLSVSAINKQASMEVSPEMVNFGAVSTSQTFTIKNVGDEGTSLHWTMTEPTVDWLTASALSGNINAGSSKSITLTIDRTKFTGDVSTNLVITAGNQNATVTVTASTAQSEMEVSTTAVDFGAISQTKSFTIKNVGDQGSVLHWSIPNPSVDWLVASPLSGSLSVGQTATVTLTIDRTKFDGNVSTDITINTGDQTASIAVTASTAQSTLVVEPTNVDFGKINVTQTFVVKNAGEEGSVMNWTIANPTVDWLAVSPMSGSINANATRTITLTLDRTKFDGDVSTLLTVTSGSQTVNVTVAASTAQYTLEVTPSSVDFGTLSNTKTFTVKNTGETGSNMSWSIDPIGVEWLTGNPMSGSLSANQTTTVTLTLDRTKFNGNVSTVLQVNGGTQNASVTVTAATPVPSMTVTPSAVDFGTTSTTQSVTIANNGQEGSVLSWSIDSPSVTWLTVTPSSGTVNANMNATVNLIIDRNAFMGVQNTNLYITGAGTTVTLPITVDNTVLAVDGLIAYYTFDDGTVNDWNGNYNGVNNGATTSTDTPSNQGYAMEFNGSTAYLQIPYVIIPTGTTWSFNIWFKTGSNDQCFMSTENYRAGLLINSSSKLYFDREIYTGWTSTTAINSYLNNQWHMLTITYNGSAIAAYMDATLIEMANGTFTWSSYFYNSMTYFGAKIASSSTDKKYFNGKMDNIRTYNRALTQAEITNLFNAKQ